VRRGYSGALVQEPEVRYGAGVACRPAKCGDAPVGGGAGAGGEIGG
jgi:hypothetical protein